MIHMYMRLSLLQVGYQCIPCQHTIKCSYLFDAITCQNRPRNETMSDIVLKLMLQSYFVLTSRNIHGPDPW
mgnify:FL=1